MTCNKIKTNCESKEFSITTNNATNTLLEYEKGINSHVLPNKQTYSCFKTFKKGGTWLFFINFADYFHLIMLPLDWDLKKVSFKVNHYTYGKIKQIFIVIGDYFQRRPSLWNMRTLSLTTPIFRLYFEIIRLSNQTF